MLRPAPPLLPSAGQEPEPYVRRFLLFAESLLRELALVALADWESMEIVSPDLFSAIASLQKPSFGHWNGLLSALRGARRSFLRGAVGAGRDKVLQAGRLQRILDLPDEKCPADLASALRPLGEFLHVEVPAAPRLGAVLTLPIALRNLVYHFAPDDAAWWSKAAGLLRPLIGFHEARRLWEITGPPDNLPAPWFERDDRGLWTFNGVERHNQFAVVYAAPDAGAPRFSTAQVRPILQSLQRLLGKRNEQEENFRRLLGELAPEELKGVLLGDYLVGRPVGQGGFATVHLATQLSTGRKVALKILHDGMPEATRLRFRQEAAYLSRFNHPHIVGVIGYGEETWAAPRNVRLDDQPWFAEFARSSTVKSFIALEWVEGRTLEEVYQSPPGQRPALTVLHEWFAQAAGALEAVHAAGLVHRDVKPSNLMATAQGAVKLMDFGIARTRDEVRSLQTTTGRPLGTPAYMSPEQLRAVDGEAEVGPAADVYGLSATFYELYTGGRLYHHDTETAHTVETRKLTGERPERPRRRRQLPWEIDAILLGGLEPDIRDRYSSVSALRRDLRRLLRSEPLEHRRPSLARRLRLWGRRNPTLAGLLAVSLLLLLGSVAAFAYYLRLQQAERINHQLATEDLDRAAERLRQEDSEGATAALERAGGRLQAAGDDGLRRRWDVLHGQMEFAAELEGLRERSLIFTPGSVTEAPLGPRYAEAFRRRGMFFGDEAPAEIAEAIDRSPIRDRIVEALHHWFGNDRASRDALYPVLERLGPPDPWLSALRTLIRNEKDVGLGRPQVRDMSAHALRCALFILQNISDMKRIASKIDRPRDNEDVSAVAPLFYQAQEAHPDDYYFNLFCAGASLTAQPPRADAALGFARAALALRPKGPAASYLVGYIFLQGKSDAGEAIPYLNRTIESDPDNAGAYSALGMALAQTGDLPAAIRAHHRAIELSPNAAALHSNLAAALRTKGDLEGAVAEARTAVEIDPAFARGHNNLGMFLRDKGDRDGALRSLTRAVELAPEDALIHYNLGSLFEQDRNWDGAVRSYRRAAQIDPGYAVAHNDLASALREQGDLESAIREFEKAISAEPGNALFHSNLGDALRAAHDPQAAVRACRRATEIDPKDAIYQNNLGAALRDAGDPAGAAAAFEKATQIDDKNVDALINSGVALLSDGKPDQALTALQKAAALAPKSGRAQYNLASAFLAKKALDPAVEALKRSIECDPNFAPAQNDLGSALEKKGDLKGAQAAFEAATRIDPKFAAAFANLGDLLLRQKDVEGAIRACRKAVEAEPGSLQAHVNLGAALQTNRQYEEATREYETAIDLDRKNPLPYTNMADLFLATGDKAGAVRMWREAVRLNPQDRASQTALALDLLSKKDFDGAAAVLNQAVKALPADALLHYYLGFALMQSGHVEEAARAYRAGTRIAPDDEQLQFGLAVCLVKEGEWDDALSAYRKVVEIKPKNGDAWFGLGTTCLNRGLFEEAVKALTQADQYGSIVPGQGFPKEPLERARKLAALDARLSKVLVGEEKPEDAAETVNLAILCHDYKERYAAAAKLFDEAFQASARLGDDVHNNYRFFAACSAVLAGARKGKDADKLPDEELPRLRARALAWLKADLAVWAEQASGGVEAREQAQKTLEVWRKTAELAGVRDKGAVDRLPEAERAEWVGLWGRVADILEQLKGGE